MDQHREVPSDILSSHKLLDELAAKLSTLRDQNKNVPYQSAFFLEYLYARLKNDSTLSDEQRVAIETRIREISDQLKDAPADVIESAQNDFKRTQATSGTTNLSILRFLGITEASPGEIDIQLLEPVMINNFPEELIEDPSGSIQPQAQIPLSDSELDSIHEARASIPIGKPIGDTTVIPEYKPPTITTNELARIQLERLAASPNLSTPSPENKPAESDIEVTRI